uniref:Zinc finger protein n=1 Tax=Rhipicephalus appendiculatus TaxID=34631 RepID=A0A131YIV3_RHIAP
MAAPSSLLLAFKAKIEESVALVPDMGAEEKLKAVQFWNVVSERLQQIVNDSAADINALALNMHGEDINVASLHDDQESQAKMAQPYIEAHGYRSENLYTEAVEEFDVTAASEGHQQELLALSAELEQVGSSQPSTQGNFSGVPLEQGSLDVSEGSLSKDSTVLLISTQAEDCPADATFDVAHQQSHNPGVLSQHDYDPNSGLVLQMPAKSANLVQNKDSSAQWQSCSEYTAKPKVQRKRRPSTRKANAKSSAKRGTTPGGKRSTGVSAVTDQRLSGTASDVQLESTPGVETTEVIVIQTRKKPKKSKEEKDRQCKVCLKELPNNSSLTTHMWTHERPFACAECNARFSTKKQPSGSPKDPLWRKAICVRRMQCQLLNTRQPQAAREDTHGRQALEVQPLRAVLYREEDLSCPHAAAHWREALPVRGVPAPLCPVWCLAHAHGRTLGPEVAPVRALWQGVPAALTTAPAHAAASGAAPLHLQSLPLKVSHQG